MTNRIPDGPGAKEQASIQQYADKIARLGGGRLQHRTPATSIYQLLKALGCRTMNYSGGMQFERRPVQPAAVNEVLIKNTLIEALRSHGCFSFHDETEGLAILDGLTLRHRWKECLGSDADAHYLAVNILSHLAAVDYLLGQNYIEHYMAEDLLLPDTVRLINGWISQETVFQGVPHPREVATAFFGEAWYHLFVEQPGANARDIAGLVRDMHPPFLPGLVTHPGDVANTLPNLDCP
jgi:hypothetical protein